MERDFSYLGRGSGARIVKRDFGDLVRSTRLGWLINRVIAL